MPVMNIYASDEYYMPLMNIIYACDDICDLCEYLRLLEKRKKRKKILRREQKPLLSAKGAPITVGCTDLRREQKAQLLAKSTPSTRAKYLALGEEPSFNESKIFGSRRRALLQREPNIGEGVAPTPNGGVCRDGKRAFDKCQRCLSAHVRREDPVALSAKPASPVGLQCVAFAESFLSAKPSTSGKGPSLRGSPLSAKTPNPLVASGLLNAHL
jgi:hypothetical protein